MFKKDKTAALAAVIMYLYMDALTLPHFGGGLCAGILTYFVFKFIYANFYKENFIARAVIITCGAAAAVSLQWLSASFFYWGIGSQAFPFQPSGLFLPRRLPACLPLRWRKFITGKDQDG